MFKSLILSVLLLISPHIHLHKSLPHAYANVTHYGAVGDGKTDSSEAFQQAIDSLKAGGEILVPVGTFVIKNVVLKSGITLRGEGKRSVLKLPVDGSIWDMVLIVGGDTRAENVSISDFTIDGSADRIRLRDVQMHGIDIQGASKNVIIENIVFQNLCGDGVRITQDGIFQIVPQNIIIKNNTFQSIGRQDIAVVHAYDVLIENNKGTGTLDVEPELALMRGVTIDNNSFTYLSVTSKNSEYDARVVVKNSTFKEGLLWELKGARVEHSTFTHIRVSDAKNVTIDHNSLRMLDIFPPFGKSASNITITNNVIDNTTTSQTDAIGGYNNQQGVGIYMWNAKDVLISGNVIRAEVTGIYLTFGCEGITIANNVIEQVKGKLKSQYGVYVVEDLKILSLKNNTYKGWTYKTKIEK